MVAVSGSVEDGVQEREGGIEGNYLLMRMRQPGAVYNDVGSQAGVLCEMTTRADETPPPKAQAQGETSTKQQQQQHGGGLPVFTAT